MNAAARPQFAHGLLYLNSGSNTQLLAVRPNGYGDVTRTNDRGVYSVGGSTDCGPCDRAAGEYGAACGDGCLGFCDAVF